jgi:murein DD-endopeptidase MepM/ murein hydrolase activator NlpD
MSKIRAILNRQIPKIRHCLLVFLALVVAASIMTLRQPQLQALNLPQQPRSIATNWRAASFPVENFQAYTSPFGYRHHPVTGEWHFHNGLDIAAPLGSYVRNWWTGKVIGLSDNTACGTTVKIQSGKWQHTYCHLSGLVKVLICSIETVEFNFG